MWFFLKWSIGLFLLMEMGSIQGVAAEPELQLEDAFLKYQKSPHFRFKQESYERQLQLKEAQLRGSRFQHQVSTQVVQSRNEVGDSRDLDSSANETRQAMVTYQQQFLNGFSWKVSNTQRFEEPVQTEGKPSTFQKLLFNASMAVYGASAVSGQMQYDQNAFLLEYQNTQQTRQEKQLYYDLASLFFDYYLSYRSYLYAKRSHQWLVQQVKQKTEASSQLSLLEQDQLRLQLLNSEQRAQDAQVQWRNTQKKMAWFLDQTPLAVGTPSIDNLKIVPFDMKRLEPRYVQHSSTLLDLKQQIRSKQHAIQLQSYQMVPDISVGGNLGQSQADTEEGRNFSVYTAITYQFGESRPTLELLKTDLRLLEADYEQQQHWVQLQAESDYLQWVSLLSRLKAMKDQLLQLQQQKEATKQGFQIGQYTYDQVIAVQLQLLQMEHQYDQSLVQLWKQWLSMLSQQNGDLKAFAAEKL